MWRVWLAVVLLGLLIQMPAGVSEVKQQQLAQGEPGQRCLGGSITYLSPSDLGSVVWGDDLPPPVPAAPQTALWHRRVDEYGSYRRMLQ